MHPGYARQPRRTAIRGPLSRLPIRFSKTHGPVGRGVTGWLEAARFHGGCRSAVASPSGAPTPANGERQPWPVSVFSAPTPRHAAVSRPSRSRSSPPSRHPATTPSRSSGRSTTSTARPRRGSTTAPRSSVSCTSPVPAARQSVSRLLSRADVVVVQHEYGIYGGDDGDDVIGVLEALTAPSIVVMHTVLEDPTPHQRRVLERVAAAATAVVVMSDTAHRLLAVRLRRRAGPRLGHPARGARLGGTWPTATAPTARPC